MNARNGFIKIDFFVFMLNSIFYSWKAAV
jgi:hypothetical protein